MYPDPQHLVVLEVVEVRRTSSVNVERLEERHPDVRHWDLHGKKKGCMDQVLQVEPAATQGTWAPLESMLWTWSVTSCNG